MKLDKRFVMNYVNPQTNGSKNCKTNTSTKCLVSFEQKVRYVLNNASGRERSCSSLLSSHKKVSEASKPANTGPCNMGPKYDKSNRKNAPPSK